MLSITQIALLAVFASVALITGAVVSMVLSQTTTERRRLREVMDVPKGPPLPEIMTLTGAAPVDSVAPATGSSSPVSASIENVVIVELPAHTT